MSDEEFFNFLSYKFGFLSEEMVLLRNGWDTLSPTVKKIMKAHYRNDYKSIYEDWKLVDDIIKTDLFAKRIEEL